MITSQKMPLCVRMLTAALMAFFGCHPLICSAQPGTKLWEVTIGTGVRIAPAIGLDGTIFVTCGSSNLSAGLPDTRTLYAISPQGTTNWTFVAGATIRSAPAIGADGTIYFGAADGLYAVSPTGATNWITTLTGFLCSSPAIGADGTIYVLSRTNRSGILYSPKLQAISPAGTVDWTCSIGDGGFGTSAQLTSPSIGPDGSIYIGSFSSAVYSISPSGSTNWIFVFDNNPASPYPTYCSPAIGSDGTIYFGTDLGKVHAVSPKGFQRWACTVPGTVESTPAIDGAGNLYFGSQGGFFCVNSAGVRTWFRAGDVISGSAAIAADGTVYVASFYTQKLFAYSPAGSNLWSFTFGVGSYCSPVIGTDGTIYVGAGTKLYAIAGTAPPQNSAWPMFRRSSFGHARAVQRSIQAIKPLPDGNVELQLTGETNRAYQVEASTNLKAWETLSSFSFTDLSMPFTDLSATNFAQRYYRLSTSP